MLLKACWTRTFVAAIAERRGILTSPPLSLNSFHENNVHIHIHWSVPLTTQVSPWHVPGDLCGGSRGFSTLNTSQVRPCRWSSSFLNSAKVRAGDHPVFSTLHRTCFSSALNKCEKGKGITFLNYYIRLMIQFLFVYFFPSAILHVHVITGVQKFYIYKSTLTSKAYSSIEK